MMIKIFLTLLFFLSIISCNSYKVNLYKDENSNVHIEKVKKKYNRKGEEFTKTILIIKDSTQNLISKIKEKNCTNCTFESCIYRFEKKYQNGKLLKKEIFYHGKSRSYIYDEKGKRTRETTQDKLIKF
jgi:hypothetical protein